MTITTYDADLESIKETRQQMRDLRKELEGIQEAREKGWEYLRERILTTARQLEEQRILGKMRAVVRSEPKPKEPTSLDPIKRHRWALKLRGGGQ